MSMNFTTQTDLSELFSTCSEAKAFVDKELKELADIWNKSVLEEAYHYEIMA